MKQYQHESPGILLGTSLLALPLVGCAKPLTLTVSRPTDGATLTRSLVMVRGMVSDAKARVMVNDTQVRPGRWYGVFTTKVELTEGVNIIKVVATRGKEVLTKTVTVTYTPSE